MTSDELLALLDTQRLRFPQDTAALDRVQTLLGLAKPVSAEPGLPEFSLPLRIQPAKACSLGWSTELCALTLLVANVAVGEDGALVHKGRGPVVAVCAEFGAPLTSLEPPTLARYSLANARAHGMPTLKLPGGFFASPLRLEPLNRSARAPGPRAGALARAEQFLDELDEAWQRRVGSVLEVAWPVYRPEKSGPLLDATAGAPLPPL